MTTRTPRSRRASSVAIVEGVALSRAVSVISRLSRAAAMPAAGEGLLHGLDEAGLLDLAGRHVDAQEGLGRDARPGDGLAAGLAQDPAPDRQDRAVLLGDLDEVAGRDEAALGVLPAHEGLDAGQGAIGQVDDRLVGEPKLAELDRVLELDAELVALADGRVHARIEDREARLAVGLGHVHRDVGVADDVLGRSFASRALAMPMLARDRDGVVADDVRRPQLARQAVGHGQRPLEVGASSVRIANSSPPRRATRSRGPDRAEIRSVTAWSSASPAAWPRVSLTTLKSSRSMNRTAVIFVAGVVTSVEDVFQAELEHAAIGGAGQRVAFGEVLDVAQQDGVAQVERGDEHSWPRTEAPGGRCRGWCARGARR